MPDLKILMERKLTLEKRLAKARQQIAEMETELAEVKKGVAAEQEQFAEARKQREQFWRDTDPAKKTE